MMLQTSIFHVIKLVSPKSEAPAAGWSILIASAFPRVHCMSACGDEFLMDQAHMCKAALHCKALVHPPYKINLNYCVSSLGAGMVVTLGGGCLGKSTMVLTLCCFLAWALGAWMAHQAIGDDFVCTSVCALLQQSTVNKALAKTLNKSCRLPTSSLVTMGSSCLRLKSHPLLSCCGKEWRSWRRELCKTWDTL